MKHWIIVFIILGVLSFILTYSIKLWTEKHKILDIPNDRSSHSIPTPRGGGLAIVICWYIGITILFISDYIPNNLYFAFLSGILLAIVGLLDDILSIKPGIRLVVQLLTASLALYLLKGIDSLEFYPWSINIDFYFLPIIAIAVVWYINLFNFLDGIDGYASIEAICMAGIMFLFTSNLINLILIAAILGFLFWNWPKARIFMGDVGSTQLGFILIVLGIFFNSVGQFPLVNWIILSSPFWFDATFTLFRRLKNHEKLGLAHKKHAYQRIIQYGFTHLKVDILLIILNIFLAIVILLISNFNYLTIPLFLLVLGLLYLITYMVDKKVPFKL